MTYDKTILSNMAVGHCGIGKYIGDYELENSPEANYCRRYFDQCRDVIYATRRWPFASTIVALADLGVTGTNYDGIWAYRYKMPGNAIRANFVVNPANRAPTTSDDKIAFEIAYDVDNEGKVILCDQDEALLDMNQLIEDPTFWDPAFAEAHSLYLALRIAPALKVDSKVLQALQQQWFTWNDEAALSAMEEGQPDPEGASQLQSIRG